MFQKLSFIKKHPEKTLPVSFMKNKSTIKSVKKTKQNPWVLLNLSRKLVTCHLYLVIPENQ